MKSELTYLLEELDNYSSNNTLSVGDLRKLIIQSFEKAAQDEERINDSMEKPM